MVVVVVVVVVVTMAILYNQLSDFRQTRRVTYKNAKC